MKTTHKRMMWRCTVSASNSSNVEKNVRNERLHENDINPKINFGKENPRLLRSKMTECRCSHPGTHWIIQFDRLLFGYSPTNGAFGAEHTVYVSLSVCDYDELRLLRLVRATLRARMQCKQRSTDTQAHTHAGMNSINKRNRSTCGSNHYRRCCCCCCCLLLLCLCCGCVLFASAALCLCLWHEM